MRRCRACENHRSSLFPERGGDRLAALGLEPVSRKPDGDGRRAGDEVALVIGPALEVAGGWMLRAFFWRQDRGRARRARDLREGDGQHRIESKDKLAEIEPGD